MPGAPGRTDVMSAASLPVSAPRTFPSTRAARTRTAPGVD
jgi:hypothetical protein